MEESKTAKGKRRTKTATKINTKLRPVSLGLSNLGNTCYANSVIQALVHLKEFHSILTTKTPTKLCKTASNDEFCSVCYFYHIIEKGFTYNEEFLKAEEVLDIIKNVGGDGMIVGLQHDAHEFLVKFLDSLACKWTDKFYKASPCKHSDCNDFSKIFRGTLQSVIECSRCHNEYLTTQPFYDLKVELDHDLNSSLQNLFSDETLTGSNKYHCTDCSCLTDATKSLRVDLAPPVLILNLNRFNARGQKLRCEFEYPLTIDLSNYTADQKKSNLVYELTTMVIHEGRFSFKGHYIAYVKGFNNKWYKCDDKTIEKVEDNSEILKLSPYILFYRMKSGSRKSYIQDKRCEHTATPKRKRKPMPKISPIKQKRSRDDYERIGSYKVIRTIINLPLISSRTSTSS